MRGMHWNRGFTLVELMIGLIIVAISLALAVPTWESIVQRRQLTSGAEQLAALLGYVQGQAVKANAEVAVTIKRNVDGTAWCLGAVDLARMQASGNNHCECDADSGDASECLVNGATAKIDQASFEKFTMSDLKADIGDDSATNDFAFAFDPVRGLKVAFDDYTTVNGNQPAATFTTENGEYALQVDIGVTGRVRICNPDADKDVPGFQACGGGG